MLDNKYNMTRQENLFYAKRNIVDSIWKSANLEGIAVTFPETQDIFDGINVAHLRIDEIQTINNLKHAWQFILYSIDSNISLKFIKSIHAFVGANIVEQPGELRCFDVSMGGTEWKPQIPKEEDINNLIESYNLQISDINATELILTFMCQLMKLQIFNDGNKRTSMLVANHQLIKYGKGIITISEKNKSEFGKRLIDYYENENKLEELKIFLLEKCLDGKGENI